MEDVRPSRGRVTTDTETLPSADYRIAVALQAPTPVEQLLRTALDLAADNDGEVLIVSVITKPRGSPFSLFTDEFIKREFSGDRQEILDRAIALADGSGVPIRGRLLVGPDVSRAIEQAVSEFDCDAVLLGWHDRRRTESVFGRNVDRVVTRAPCDVLVEKIGHTANSVERILLPAGKGPNTELAASVASAIAVANDAGIDVLRLVDQNASRAERTDAHEHVRTVGEALEPVTAVSLLVEETDSVAETITEATADRDVTVLGATDRTWTQRLAVGPTPEKVGRNAQGTVIVTRRGDRLTSTLNYWLRRLG
ncbi:universal stress protein [Halocatena pleomorpha]|uniref:Universal stress protein n=1 Tax=Halocatena pleomorpha TaxID=1785090 RepID=A0A3P3R8Y3_9EURY|nr:universal stress protein [Halocatena pleomorpha]RRJ29110.1 universal stress protein [Halocatena pleomorpha]